MSPSPPRPWRAALLSCRAQHRSLWLTGGTFVGVSSSIHFTECRPMLLGPFLPPWPLCSLVYRADGGWPMLTAQGVLSPWLLSAPPVEADNAWCRDGAPLTPLPRPHARVHVLDLPSQPSQPILLGPGHWPATHRAAGVQTWSSLVLLLSPGCTAWNPSHWGASPNLPRKWLFSCQELLAYTRIPGWPSCKAGVGSVSSCSWLCRAPAPTPNTTTDMGCRRGAGAQSRRCFIRLGAGCHWACAASALGGSDCAHGGPARVALSL